MEPDPGTRKRSPNSVEERGVERHMLETPALGLDNENPPERVDCSHATVRESTVRWPIGERGPSRSLSGPSRGSTAILSPTSRAGPGTKIIIGIAAETAECSLQSGTHRVWNDAHSGRAQPPVCPRPSVPENDNGLALQTE